MCLTLTLSRWNSKEEHQTKQAYSPSSNVLSTKVCAIFLCQQDESSQSSWSTVSIADDVVPSHLPDLAHPLSKFLNEVGVGQVTDFIVPKASVKGNKPFLPWLIRRVQVIRGKVKFRLECAPAFDYARGRSSNICHQHVPSEGPVGVLIILVI